MELFVIGWIIVTLVGYLIGRGKGRPLDGFLLGITLGVIGWIIMACLQPSYAEQVRRQVVRDQIKADATSQQRDRAVTS